MPHIKNALIRYRIIDRSLRNNYRPYPSKKDLRELCEEALFGSVEGENICDSTIEKDLFAMRLEHDAPIKYNKREGGYFYTDPEFSINDIPLSNDDVTSIKFAINTLRQFREVDMFKQFGNAIDKIVDRITISEDPRDQDISNFVQFEVALSSSGNEFLSPLLEAIRGSNLAFFGYTSFISGKLKDRKVVPLLLKEYRNRWYLISFDLEKKEVMTYALERMTNVEILKEKGEKPIDFDPDLFFKYAIGITSSEDEPSLIIFKTDNISAKYIVSQPFHSSQKIIKEGKNKTTFELNILISEEFTRSILSYGGGIEVVEPKELRDEIIVRLEEMMRNYSID